MLLVDTSGLLSALFREQRLHPSCAEALLRAEPPFLLSPFVLAELDFLVLKLAGIRAELDLLQQVVDQAYDLAPFTAADIAEARAVAEEHAEHAVGLADASLVVLSRRHRVVDVLTLDERHFRVLRGAGGRPFRILPADG